MDGIAPHKRRDSKSVRRKGLARGTDMGDLQEE
jgi:hypothetical protein